MKPFGVDKLCTYLVHVPMLHQMSHIASLHDVFHDNGGSQCIHLFIRCNGARRCGESLIPSLLTIIIKLFIKDICGEGAKQNKGDNSVRIIPVLQQQQ